MDLLAEAVRENASWCALVCAARGVEVVDDGRVQVTTSAPPPFYPDAMTLVADATAHDVLAVVGDRRPVGVKDSFARTDLAPAGLVLLFEASWIGLDGAARTGAADARDLGDGGLGPDVVLLEVARDGTVLGRGTAHRDGGVIGLSNVEAARDDDLGDLVRSLVHGARDRLGDLPVVGYEHGASLEAVASEGFSLLGPLRVWVRG